MPFLLIPDNDSEIFGGGGWFDGESRFYFIRANIEEDIVLSIVIVGKRCVRHNDCFY